VGIADTAIGCCVAGCHRCGFRIMNVHRLVFFINVNYYAKCETVINNQVIYFSAACSFFSPFLTNLPTHTQNVDSVYGTVEMINIIAFASPFI
jgi:hypothetical protein